VLGDEAQPAESERSRDSATCGPRHAAPRKSLLTKLHVPGGKAVALAAMPTAVLMGLGFTPHLAQADDMPESPYTSGPCVTQPETPSPSATGTDKPSAATATPKPSASPSATPTGTPAEPAPSPSAPKPGPTATDAPVTGLLPDSGTAAEEPVSPSPSPSATQSTQSIDPLDPLGVGDLLGGLLGDSTSTVSPAPTTSSPAPEPTTTAPATPDPGTSPAPTAPAPQPVSAAVADSVATPAGSTTKGATDAAGEAVKDLADATATTATPTPSSAATEGSAAADGTESYPCPTHDAQALADARAEKGIPLLANTPWVLKTSKLSLHGLHYGGIVKVRRANGELKDVLKFTATGVDIENLHQIVDEPGGTKTHVTSRAGSTSTIRNGTVTMYTESLSGNLFGAVPVTFTPDAPPPLTLEELVFTDVTVIQAAQFGGDLHVPGMSLNPGEPS
jgi:hypothetical protein